MTAEDLRKLINANMDQLTKTQKALGAFILEHLSECAFATLEEIAQQSGVSTASIIRFARKLGFTGFPELKEKIQEEFRDSVTTATKLERRIEMFSGSAQVLRELLEMEGEQASRLITEELALNYAAAVQKLASVRELILYGEGASATLTYLLEFRFRRFGYRVTRINESGRYFFYAVLNLPRDGAAVVCGLGRPPRERQFFLRRAKKCGNTTILITDSSVSGLRAGADYVLPVAGRSVGVFQSLVMPTLIAEALALGVAVEKREEIMDSFQELDDLRREFGYPNIGGLLWR